MAKYLNTITIQSNRKAMAQLRLSSHKLMIERGRWNKIVHKERPCLHCQVLEDEYHVVIVCPKYTAIRKQYIKPYYRNYSCISRTFLYQFHTQKLGMRLIFEVQIFSGLITNCNHKLSSRWSHINAATSLEWEDLFGESDDEDFEGIV